MTASCNGVGEYGPVSSAKLDREAGTYRGGVISCTRCRRSFARDADAPTTGIALIPEHDPTGSRS